MMENSATGRRFPSLLKNLFLLTLPGLIFTLLLLELFFRFVVPACEMPSVYFDPTDRILRYDTRGRKEGIATLGKWGEGRARWRINNYGWNSEIDYAPAEGPHRPLLALIGDSYIDALQVDVADNIAAQTRRALGGGYQIYSFGIGGAPLSQYLLMSRYVRRHFNPSVMVFNVVHNDFDESLVELENMPYFLELSFQG
ncbi:MAG TPA: hypothetical protein VKL61_08745, partial [Candidatus Polarisedimenticolia bacterium]|nr:hypothetical protein [Candidatus Polarisedimenticolia bacterium]